MLQPVTVEVKKIIFTFMRSSTYLNKQFNNWSIMLSEECESNNPHANPLNLLDSANDLQLVKS